MNNRSKTPLVLAIALCWLSGGAVFAQELSGYYGKQIQEPPREALPAFDPLLQQPSPGVWLPPEEPVLQLEPGEAFVQSQEPCEPQGPVMPKGTRPGVFQKVTFDATWLATGSGPIDFGMTDLETKAVFGFPCPARTSPLVVTPGFGVHFFDGPEGFDVPGQVYDAYTTFRWMRSLGPRWGIDLAVSPGWYSDFEQGSSRALRISGYGAAAFTWLPTTKLVLGLAYLDREDISFLPVAGVIWTPNEDTSFELIAPRPKIARRIVATPDDTEIWIYLAGEFGGGTWAIQRLGEDDLLTYGDYRVLLGLERKAFGRLSASAEVGFVFGRKLEFGSGAEIEPDPTVLLRGGLAY